MMTKVTSYNCKATAEDLRRSSLSASIFSNSLYYVDFHINSGYLLSKYIIKSEYNMDTRTVEIVCGVVLIIIICVGTAANILCLIVWTKGL